MSDTKKNDLEELTFEGDDEINESEEDELEFEGAPKKKRLMETPFASS